MKISELLEDLTIRHPRKFDDQVAVDAYKADLLACGLKDGPALADVFQAYRASWKYERAPRAAELAAFYIPPARHYTEQETIQPDPEKWADEYLRSDHGQAAILSGVGYDCKVYCLQNPGKRPPPEYIDEMKAAKVKNMTETLPRLRDAQMRDRDRPNDGTVAFGLTGSLIRLWDTMEARNEELGREYRREPAA